MEVPWTLQELRQSWLLAYTDFASRTAMNVGITALPHARRPALYSRSKMPFGLDSLADERVGENNRSDLRFSLRQKIT